MGCVSVYLSAILLEHNMLFELCWSHLFTNPECKCGYNNVSWRRGETALLLLFEYLGGRRYSEDNPSVIEPFKH